MAEKFKLQNLADQCEKDKFYRLDIIPGVSFEDAYDPSMPFKTYIVNFSLYSNAYQSLEEIKSIPAKDIFKNDQIEWEPIINKEAGEKRCQTVTLAVKVDVTNQIFLKSGTVWLNGSPVWEPSEFFNISINQSKSEIVTFKAELDLETKMPFIKGGLGIQFLKFPSSKVDKKVVDVLIPTTEVIRYYYSGSTYFTQQLFNGALSEFKSKQVANKLFYDFNFDEDSETVYIWLKRNCYDSDAILLARALADSEAMNAMSYIYPSLAYAKKNFKNSNGSPVSESCPRTKLPFSDDTDMEVLGQWLPPNDKGEFTTFIVRTIEKCDHSLPFKKIEIESVDSYSSSGKDAKDKKPKPAKKKNKESPKNVELTQGEKPTNTIEPEELDFYLQRFNHLQDVEIEKIKKVSEKEKEQRFKAESESDGSGKGSTLPGDYSKDNGLQPWQNRINDAETIPVSDRITAVSNAVEKIINKRADLKVTCMPVGFTDSTAPYGLYSFERPKNKGSDYSWNWVNNRPRLALFLEIFKNDEDSIYLLEIEGKNGVGYSLYLFANPSKGFDVRGSARALMFDIANSSGSKIVTGTMKIFSDSSSLKHVVTDDDSFADRIERAIDGLFEEAKK